MSTPGEPHALSPAIPTPPILSVPFDPRVVEAQNEEPGFDLKGYLNTL